MVACDALDAIAANAAWSLFCECAMSGGMFVNCYLPLLPLCEAQQPAMSAGRVEQPAVLSYCWLCATQDSMEAMKPMGSNDLPEPVLRCIVERYCNNMVPLICCVCDVFIATAVKTLPKPLLQTLDRNYFAVLRHLQAEMIWESR